MHLNGLWWCLCRVIGAVRSAYIQVSAPVPLLPPNNALVLRRAQKRADPDQPNALSLASAGGCNLDACACFLGSTWGGDRGLSHELLWTYIDNLSTFTLLEQIAQIPQNLLLARVNYIFVLALQLHQTQRCNPRSRCISVEKTEFFSSPCNPP